MHITLARPSMLTGSASYQGMRWTMRWQTLLCMALHGHMLYRMVTAHELRTSLSKCLL